MTTTQATRLKIYRNEATGYALTMVTDAQGVIHVTDSEAFHATTVDADRAETILWERSLRFGAKPHQAPAPTMASPLATDAQVPSANLGRGSSLTTMTDAQARVVSYALKRITTGVIHRGSSELDGYATAPMLRAMARRGWLELDDKIRPTYGTVTDAGRTALEWYDAQARKGG